MTILKNAAAPEYIPTYDGSNQSTHPSVLYFADGWHGFRYWMGMTPYPFNMDDREDPSILASNDGRTWQTPQGVTNPLTPKPEPGHNCDVELIYVPENDEMRMYYVEADDVKQSWVKLMRSSDGVHWSKPETVIHDEKWMYGILSPTIQRLADGTWQMMYVDTGNTGYQNQSNAVRLRTSKDGIVWSEQQTVTALAQNGYQIWHIEVRYDAKNDTFHAVYPAYPNGTNCDYCELFYAVKHGSAPWQTYAQPILKAAESGAWDDFCIYRGSLLIDTAADTMQLWYGAKKKSDASWNMGYVESDYTKFVNALKISVLNSNFNPLFHLPLWRCFQRA